MLFSQVKGQEQLKQKIKSLIDGNRFPHAILFDGKDGYGTLAVALATAQYLSCTDRQEGIDACNKCMSCKKYSKLIHPDLHLIFPTTTTKRIDKNNESSLFIAEFRDFVQKYNGYPSLEDWYIEIGSENKQGVINVRDADKIISTLTLKSYESPYKIMVIWNADKMNTEAANKLLKIIEEPYEKTFFILTTQHKDMILPTILSRVQTIIVPPLDNETMYATIKEYDSNLSEQEINIKIALCEGDYNRIRQIDSDVEAEKVANFVEINRLAMMYKKSAKDISDFVDVFSKTTRNQQKDFLDYFLVTIEKIWRYNNGVQLPCHPLEQMGDKFKTNYPKFITKNNIEPIVKVIEQAQNNIDHNANAKINFFDMILKLGYQLEKR